MKNKAQNEIMGFIMIIILITIIGLVILGITLANQTKKQPRTSIEITDYLQAAMYQTTNSTKIHPQDYLNIQKLIKECYKKNKCRNNIDPCKHLNQTLSDLTQKSFQTGQSASIKAYKINIYYKNTNEEQPNEEILTITNQNLTNCTTKLSGDKAIPMRGENIKIDMQLCLN